MASDRVPQPLGYQTDRRTPHHARAQRESHSRRKEVRFFSHHYSFLLTLPTAGLTGPSSSLPPISPATNSSSHVSYTSPLHRNTSNPPSIEPPLIPSGRRASSPREHHRRPEREQHDRSRTSTSGPTRAESSHVREDSPVPIDLSDHAAKILRAS